MLEHDGRLYAATSAWHAGLQTSDDEGRTWTQIYDRPTPPRRVSRIIQLAAAAGRVFGAVVDRLDDGEHRNLGMLTQEGFERVPGWPRDRHVQDMLEFDGWLYAAVWQKERVAVWRTNGERSEQIAPAGEAPSLRALTLMDGQLWGVGGARGKAALWKSATGDAWQRVQDLPGFDPVDIVAFGEAIFVGGTGHDGRGVLWGPRIVDVTAATASKALSRVPPTNIDWSAAAREVDRLLRDSSSYLGGLRNALYPLTEGAAPTDWWAARLQGNFAHESVPMFGGRELPARHLGAWVLLWAMGLARQGPVDANWLAGSWTRAANRSEKYFDPQLMALFAIRWNGQNDRDTIDALLRRIRRTDDPLWLRGDAIGTLTAVTGQRFGYDVATWLSWWAKVGGSP